MYAAVLAIGAMSLVLPTPVHEPFVSRRLALARLAGAGSLLAAVPNAHAGMGKEAKVDQTESIAKAKAFKYEARPVAGNESPQFLEAEKKRKAAQLALERGEKPKEETAAEAMARLGLKTMQ